MTNLEYLEKLCCMVDEGKALEKIITDKVSTDSDLKDTLSFLKERNLVLDALTGLENESNI